MCVCVVLFSICVYYTTTVLFLGYSTCSGCGVVCTRLKPTWQSVVNDMIAIVVPDGGGAGGGGGGGGCGGISVSIFRLAQHHHHEENTNDKMNVSGMSNKLLVLQELKQTLKNPREEEGGGG
uniref:Uncharacterized protein n=1 Tax=Octopus bimaculoides TaxID=37653 RepID=A0A0L8FG24_OCTBM